MKKLMNSKRGGRTMKRTTGFTLLDVLLGILVFAVGMLALASLQTNLTRSSVDSNARTVAMNIGEEIIEQLRTFQRVETDPEGQIFAFADIDQAFVSNSYERAGLNYSVTGTVLGYDFNDEKTDVVEPVPAVAGEVYDFKLVELIVAWDNSANFQVDENETVSAADLNSGQITVQGIIPSIPALANARLAADEEIVGAVPVMHTPGLRPDFVAINLGNGKLKESNTPLPADLAPPEDGPGSWFEVITYNGNAGNQILRREEFLVVPCECRLRQPAGGVGGGYLPTIWNGTEYVTGPTLEGDRYVERDVFVPKTYGESTSNTPGVDYCETCCRDHHDSAEYSSADEVYDPARLSKPDDVWTEFDGSGDHVHFARSKGKDNSLTPANVNGIYVEACRMVRKDGFMRVAQDFRQEGFLAFPEGFLDIPVHNQNYADYVVAAVTDYYEQDRDALTSPGGETAGGGQAWDSTKFVFPGTEINPTSLPFPGAGGVEAQQMRSRAIYIDHLSSEASQIIKCLHDHADADPMPAPCDATGMQNFLEAYPFFEVQTTLVSWWNENSAGDPISITQKTVKAAGDSVLSGGYAVLENPDAEPATVIVTTEMHRGNVGLSRTDPISPLDTVENATGTRDLTVSVNQGVDPVSNDVATFWSGTFESAVNGVNAADATVKSLSDNTYCRRSGNKISCLTALGSPGGPIEISDYFKNAGTPLYICVNNFPGVGPIDNSLSGAEQKVATFGWEVLGNRNGVSITIESEDCAAP